MKDNGVFIKTKNAVRIINFATNMIRKNEWAVVIGEPGSGKSAIRKELVTVLESDPKFKVIEIPGFVAGTSRAGAIMKLMIQEIDPDTKVPGSLETKYATLRSVLSTAASYNWKVAVVFEETQHLTHTTMRELKLLHEIEGMGQRHLFSMVMFLQDIKRFTRIFESREIGHRVNIQKMRLLEANEVIQIAEERYNMKFQDDQAKEVFVKVTYGFPVSVEHWVKRLCDYKDFDGVITSDALTGVKIDSIRDGLKEHKITNRDIRDYMRENGYKDVSIAFINESLNGKRHGETPDEVLQSAMGVIEERRRKVV